MRNKAKTYVQFRAEGKKFHFKQELNPSTNEMEYHIWIRHLIEPETVLKAFFSIDKKRFNEKHNRFEAYSAIYNLMIYYMEFNANEVLVITAFYL